MHRLYSFVLYSRTSADLPFNGVGNIGTTLHIQDTLNVER